MSAIPADLRQPAGEWRTALLSLGLVLAAILLLYRDTAIAMVGIWSRSDTFAHAFLVPPISLWLIWRRRELLKALQPAPQPWVLPLMALGAIGWLLGDLVGVNAVTQLALVALIVLSVPAVLGMAVTREVLFPLAFLFFCVPIGEFLMPTLMEGTADFTIAALQYTGIPVYREGLQFVIPSGQWSVVEACSGVRYLIASFMVGTLFGYLNFNGLRKRLIFAGVSLVVPIVANWLRAYMIVMIGHLSGNTLAVGVDHLIYGWVFFGIVITTMFMIGSRWSDPELPLRPAGNAGGQVLSLSRRSPWAIVAGVALVLLLPQAALKVLDARGGAPAKPVVTLPDALASGSAAVATPVSDWTPRFLGAATEANRSYRVGDATVGVHIAYYRGQTYENKLVSSQNVLVMSEDRRWNRIATRGRSVDLGGQPVTLQSSELLGAGSTGQANRPMLNVWQVYWVDGKFTASDPWAKVHGAVSRLSGRGDDGAAIFLYTVGDPQTHGQPTLEAFARANLASLATLLQRTRDAR